jgi:predicted alpha/beta-hydrolase family hydrolase
MPEPTYLDITAEDGRPLRHKYLQQEGLPKGLLVSFPGDNYGMDGPLLYYPSQILWAQGWDTAAITYGYQSAGMPFSPLAIAAVLEECQIAVSTIMAERPYSRLVLAGKSLGASLVALLCQEMALPERTLAIYLTPPLGPLFNPVFLGSAQPAYMALGTADRFYNAAALSELQNMKSFRLQQVEGADHSMNIPGDLSASMAAVRMVTEGVVEFIASTGAMVS